MSLESNRVYLGDCLELMKSLDSESIDMVLCDLPYGTTAASWDSVICLTELWIQYQRVCKLNAAIVLTASQPFTSVLGASNISMLKYAWIWEKSKASNFLLARKQPLKAHEDILVFCRGTPTYNPQKTTGKPFKGAGRSIKGSQTELVNHVPNPTFRNDNTGDRFPRSIQYFVTAEREGCLHPTQKPIALMEYLIRTHSNVGDLILDNAMGSGTTCVAARNTQRNFIGMDNNVTFYNKALARLEIVTATEPTPKE